MPEYDDYAAARAKVDALCLRINQTRTDMAAFHKALGGTPHSAAHVIPENWPSRDDLVALLSDLSSAWDDMTAKWLRIPDGQRANLNNGPRGMIFELTLRAD